MQMMHFFVCQDISGTKCIFRSTFQFFHQFNLVWFSAGMLLLILTLSCLTHLCRMDQRSVFEASFHLYSYYNSNSYLTHLCSTDQTRLQVKKTITRTRTLMFHTPDQRSVFAACFHLYRCSHKLFSGSV